MKSWLWKVMLASAIVLPALSGAVGEAAQEQKGQEQQGIEGVWDVQVTVVQCDTGKALLTGRAVLMFSDGGGLTEISDTPLHSAGLGMWRHLRAQSYTAVDNTFFYNTDGSLAGTQVVTRDIELSGNADEYTATATFEFFDPADKLIRSGCATSTATRLE